MNKTKLLLACILKDDSEFELAERMLNTFMPHFQGLVVALTGASKDHNRLKSLIKRHKGRYLVTTPLTHPKIYLEHEGKQIFGNFAEARNTVFAMAQEEQAIHNYDYWCWADADDVLVNGQELDRVAEKAKEMNVDAVFFNYWYSVVLNPDNTVKDIIIDHLRERLLKPNTFKWVSRLHEVAVPIDDNYKVRNSLYDFNQKEGRNAVWMHLAKEDRQKENLMRNIVILDKQIVEENRKDPRTIFYLAKTYYDINLPEYDKRAEQLIYEYVDLSGWAEERSNAWEYVGNIKSRSNDHRGAIDAYHIAIKEYPNRNMPYLLLAREYAELDLNDESNFWTEMALKMDPPKARTTIGNPMEIKTLASTLKYNQAIKKQDLPEAIKWLGIRNQIIGLVNDPMVKTLEDAKLLNDAAIWVFNYAKWLKETGNSRKIASLLESLPLELGREAFAHHIANDIREPKVWDDNSIVYYASFGGEHFEQWSAKSLTKGIGGSETAVIELAKRWAEQGYDVTVYGDPREDEGEIDGVTYKPYYTFNWKDEFSTLILWRSPHLLDREIKAKRLFMDLHDIASQMDWTEPRMEKINKVFFKSEAHRKMLPKLPEEKAVIISNGI